MNNNIATENGFVVATMKPSELDLEALYGMKPKYKAYIGKDGLPHEEWNFVIGSKIFHGFKWWNDETDKEFVIQNSDDKVIFTVPYADTEICLDEPEKIIVYVQSEDTQEWDAIEFTPSY